MDPAVAEHPLLASYTDGLLLQALDLGDRLLLAFDTATGLPYSKINLRHGLDAASRRNQVSAMLVGSQRGSVSQTFGSTGNMHCLRWYHDP